MRVFTKAFSEATADEQLSIIDKALDELNAIIADPQTSAAQKKHARKRGLILQLWACRHIPQFGNDPHDEEYGKAALHRIGTAGYALLDAEGDLVAVAADETWAQILVHQIGEAIAEKRGAK